MENFIYCAVIQSNQAEKGIKINLKSQKVANLVRKFLNATNKINSGITKDYSSNIFKNIRNKFPLFSVSEDIVKKFCLTFI